MSRRITQTESMRSVLWLPVVSLLVAAVHLPDGVSPSRADDDDPRDTHPLMPGVRSVELWNAQWPRTFHDKLVTGFSPLTCDMQQAPQVWSTIATPARVDWLRVVQGHDGQQSLLVCDGRLRLVDASGNVRWTNNDLKNASRARVLYYGDLRGVGSDALLLADGPTMTLMDAQTGAITWRHTFEPDYVGIYTSPQNIVVADILSDRPGLEAAVFPLYGEMGYLFQFPPQGDPDVVWEQLGVVPDEHAPGPGGGERADHGCWIDVDFSVPDAPTVWTLRYNRCRGFDARTGELVSSLIYEVGGQHRRNYGSAVLGWSKSGERLLCVVTQAVQFHVHAIRLNRNGPSELAWEHFYGELLKDDRPGTCSLKMIAVDDLDGDGATEIAYNVQSEQDQFRPYVRVRDAGTGDIQAELADCICETSVTGGNDDPRPWFVVRPAQGHAVPHEDLLVYRLDASGQFQQVAHWPAIELWNQPSIASSDPGRLLIREQQSNGAKTIADYRFDGSELRIDRKATSPELASLQPAAVIGASSHRPLWIESQVGQPLRALSWAGETAWSVDVAGGLSAALSAADLNGDGACELLAATAADGLLHIYSFDAGGSASELRTHPCPIPDPASDLNPLSPLLYDLEGNGSLCVICPGVSADGKPAMRAFRADGTLLWERVLDPRSGPGYPPRWNAGDFLPDGRTAVAVSSQVPQQDSIQGTYLLDGPTGEVVWNLAGYLQERGIGLPYYPMGVPTAFDFDDDGIEEIGMDFYCYMAWLRGTDGSFAFLRQTANLGGQDALFAGRFHNSYLPAYQSPDDNQPHWFVPLGGHGSVGLMNPEPSEGIWRDELGYDMPRKVGLIDVDADGRLEVGYVPRSGTKFVCRDLWTGTIEWELDLPEMTDSRVITADVDSDGKGEFLIGHWCIATRDGTTGQILWESPVPLDQAIIADFDGDGTGDIACSGHGHVHILRARPSQTPDR